MTEKTGSAAQTAAKTKKFADTDLISCTSVTAGQFFFEGGRSKELYTFADAGDTLDIEYRDIMYAVRSKAAAVYKPRFVINDRDFLAQHKDIGAVYGTMYSTADLADMLKLSPSQLRRKAAALPDGAKETLKSIAAERIDNGSFDSVQRIKVLDEIFGTKLLFTLTGK